MIQRYRFILLNLYFKQDFEIKNLTIQINNNVLNFSVFISYSTNPV